VEVEALLESGVPWSIVYVDAIDLSPDEEIRLSKA